MLKLFLGWLAINAALLLAIWLIVRGWQHTRPLTGPQLAKHLDRETNTDSQRPALSFGETAFLLRETGRPSETRLLSAVLTAWQGSGQVTCRTASKKRLVSFGDEMQPTLSFSDAGAELPGAEGALFALLSSGCDSGTMQSGEAYNWARENAPSLRNALLRFEAEGRAVLRAEGAVREETRKHFLGPQERLIYTPRGLRRALALRCCENHLRQSPDDCPAYAVLFGYAEPPQPLNGLCESLTNGYTAGLRSTMP